MVFHLVDLHNSSYRKTKCNKSLIINSKYFQPQNMLTSMNKVSVFKTFALFLTLSGYGGMFTLAV